MPSAYPELLSFVTSALGAGGWVGGVTQQALPAGGTSRGPSGNVPGKLTGTEGHVLMSDPMELLVCTKLLINSILYWVSPLHEKGFIFRSQSLCV